jgi:hypothetical protein
MYVDDTIITAPKNNTITAIMDGVAADFKIKDLGEPTLFLGCKVSRDYAKRTITLSQEQYVEKIIADAHMERSSGTNIPINFTYFDASKKKAAADADADADLDLTNGYMTHTGRLGWLSYKTQPDITFATRRLQHAQSNPTDNDWSAVKTVMRYLKRHPDFKIVLGSNHDDGPKIYVDAAHADAPGMKSTEGYIFMYAGVLISWSSCRQTIVTPSSSLAKFCAYDSAVKEALWAKKLLVAMTMIGENKPIPIYTDSANAMINVTKEGYNGSNKWLDLRYFFVRDEFKKKSITFVKIDGDKNAADGLTKPLAHDKFTEFVKMISGG